MLDTVLPVAAAILGACVGSFLNVVIYRVPEGAFFRKGRRSVCPQCGEPIRWHDNLPILSWFLLRGRARCCGKPIAWRYPAVEALTAALFLLLFLQSPFGPVVVDGAWQIDALLALLFQFAFLAILVACTFIDLDHRILPDVLTKPGMVLALVGAFVVPELAGRLPIRNVSPAMASTLFSAIGIATGIGLTWGIRVLARAVFRKEAMGLGDVKFMGMIGGFLGWNGALMTFFLACVTGAVGGLVHRVLTKDAYVPFGPFLSIGALLTLFFGEEIQDFLLVTWPEWQRNSTAAPWILSGTAVVCIFALVVLVRRGRGPS